MNSFYILDMLLPFEMRAALTGVENRGKAISHFYPCKIWGGWAKYLSGFSSSDEDSTSDILSPGEGLLDGLGD